MSMRTAVVAVIGFVIIVSVIDTAVTGTDTGSELVQDLGPLIAGASVLMALIFKGAFGGRG